MPAVAPGALPAFALVTPPPLAARLIRGHAARPLPQNADMAEEDSAPLASAEDKRRASYNFFGGPSDRDAEAARSETLQDKIDHALEDVHEVPRAAPDASALHFSASCPFARDPL